MKVGELIEKLRAVPADMEVETEGCDCDGDLAFVVLCSNRVLLARSNADYSDNRGEDSEFLFGKEL